MKVIGITGPIGSGKSVVCKCLEALGYPIYNTDSQAKRIMNESREIHRQIREKLSEDAISDGAIDRVKLAKIVFNDKSKLDTLNHIVHTKVREDLDRWLLEQGDENICFIESAILFSSGFDKGLDEIWIVEAPSAIRSQRVIYNRGMDKADFERRNSAQKDENRNKDDDYRVFFILNDDRHPLLPQIEHHLERNR